MSTPGHFGTNEKRLLPNFQDFCSRTFCYYSVVYVDLWNNRQLVKISLSGSQNPDPNTFFVSALIKNPGNLVMVFSHSYQNPLMYS